MRNGNDIAEKESLRRHQIVLTVPMRNGNSTVYAMQFEAVKVLTVPMRNGNEAQAKAAQIGIWRSYRTYEEWKLLSNWPVK